MSFFAAELPELPRCFYCQLLLTFAGPEIGFAVSPGTEARNRSTAAPCEVSSSSSGVRWRVLRAGRWRRRLWKSLVFFFRAARRTYLFAAPCFVFVLNSNTETWMFSVVSYLYIGQRAASDLGYVIQDSRYMAAYCTEFWIKSSHGRRHPWLVAERREFALDRRISTVSAPHVFSSLCRPVVNVTFCPASAERQQEGQQ